MYASDRVPTVGQRADAPATGPGPRAPVAGHTGVGQGEVPPGDCQEGGSRQQLREPDGQPDRPGTGHRGGDP